MKIDTLILGPLGTNCYIVYNEGSGEAVVIDPAAEEEKILDALEEKRVCAVLLTHGHCDHTAALSAFAGTPIYIHPADDIMLSDPLWSLARSFGDRADRPAATDYVQEGTKLHLAGLDISVVHLPGHTMGSVAYAVGDVLFTGDVMFHHAYGRTDFPGGDPAAMAASLRRLLKMEKNWIICPGHGEMTTLQEEREFYR